jgi:hypothetical protein
MSPLDSKEMPMRLARYGVFRAVETEDRFFDFRRQLDRVLRRGDAGFQIRIVRRVMPHAASATAKAHDAEPAAVAALRLCPGHRGVEISKIGSQVLSNVSLSEGSSDSSGDGFQDYDFDPASSSNS